MSDTKFRGMSNLTKFCFEPSVQIKRLAKSAKKSCRKLRSRILEKLTKGGLSEVGSSFEKGLFFVNSVYFPFASLHFAMAKQKYLQIYKCKKNKQLPIRAHV